MSIETRDGRRIAPQWLFKSIYSYASGAVVQNAYYTVIPTTSDVIVNYLSFISAGAQNYTFRATIDGVVILSGTISGGTGAARYIYLDTATDTLDGSATITAFNQITPEYARSFMLEFENTSGTAGITAIMRWNSL